MGLVGGLPSRTRSACGGWCWGVGGGPPRAALAPRAALGPIGREPVHRLHGRVVLFDRYTLDAMVPSGAAIGPLACLSRRVQGHACPRPDVVLVLDASGVT